jgi:hypothetical protein
MHPLPVLCVVNFILIYMIIKSPVSVDIVPQSKLKTKRQNEHIIRLYLKNERKFNKLLYRDKKGRIILEMN